MLRRRTIKNSKAIMMMSVTVIFCLSVIGTNYAQWNNGIELGTSLFTGNMEPAFSRNLKLDGLHGDGRLKAKLQGKNLIKIKGKVETGYKGKLNYDVLNNGTIPFEYIGEEIDSQNGINLRLKQKGSIFAPAKSSGSGNGNSELQIKASEAGEYDFEIELKFKQCDD